MLQEKLKSLRKERNKSQKQVADYLNIAQTTYSSYEVGTTEPNLEMLKKIANLFNVKIEYLIDEVNEKNEPTTEENEMLKMFNSLSDIEKIKVKGYMQGLIDNRLTKSIQNTESKNKFNY